MSIDDEDDDDKTPTGKGPPLLLPAAGPDAVDLADTAVVLSTVATRLRHQADLADAAASRSREAARMAADFSAEDRAAAIRDIEEDLRTLGDAVHDTRRVLWQHRRQMKDPH